MFVMWYSNSCGACSRCKPFFEETAQAMIDQRPELTLAAVDNAKAPELAKRYDISSYPTFLFFKSGKMKYKVNIGHSAEKMIEFCNDPKFIELPKAESGFSVASNVTILMKNAQAWLDVQPSAMIMAHTDWCGHCKKMKPDYINAADDLYAETGQLAAIDGDRFKPFLQPFGVTGFPTLLYFENGEFQYKYQGPRTRDGIVKFMRNPTESAQASQAAEETKKDEMLIDIPDEVTILDNTNFEDFVDANSKVIVMFYAPWCGVCKAAKPSYFEAAEMLADEDDETKFAVFNCDSNDPADALYSAQFGVTGYPSIYFFDEGEQKYKFGGFHDVDAFLRFGRDPKGKGREGKVSADGVSLSGWSNQEGVENVIEVAEEDWDELVNSKKHVLLFWYTPWCIRCLDVLKPQFIQAADDILELRSNTLFAVCDGHTEKDLKGRYGIESFPTLQYFKNGVFEYNYEGSLDADKLVNFMKSPTKEKAAKPEKWAWEKQDPASYGLVLHGNIDTLPGIYDQYTNVLIMIHGSGFEACHRAYETTREASYILSDYDDFRIVAIDCARGPKWGKVCYNYGVHSYPDFRFFKNGEQIDDWDGNGADLNELVEYIQTMRQQKDEL